MCVKLGGNGRKIGEKYDNLGQILLPSAVHLEERLTVSHSVPAPGQQSVRQKHTVWVFCQWQMRPQAVGPHLSRD